MESRNTSSEVRSGGHPFGNGAGLLLGTTCTGRPRRFRDELAFLGGAGAASGGKPLGIGATAGAGSAAESWQAMSFCVPFGGGCGGKTPPDGGGLGAASLGEGPAEAADEAYRSARSCASRTVCLAASFSTLIRIRSAASHAISSTAISRARATNICRCTARRCARCTCCAARRLAANSWRCPLARWAASMAVAAAHRSVASVANMVSRLAVLESGSEALSRSSAASSRGAAAALRKTRLSPRAKARSGTSSSGSTHRTKWARSSLAGSKTAGSAEPSSSKSWS
mmetsp:Transcript_25608/g.82703  ORF Transcript_25608/g.82703 Transcript_25608/m.82703 type:complete len:284 (-) Transcript_25608:866-1717(-)|eukprot:scaffold8943_cov103-Isochrysis_galbana.AAC.7